MKKSLFLALMAVSALALTGCRSVYTMVHTTPATTEVSTSTIADLEVSPKMISYIYRPTNLTKRTGRDNIVATAVREALRANGNAHVLVEARSTVSTKTGLFGTKITEVEITGFPAYYRNFRSAYVSGPAPVPFVEAPSSPAQTVEVSSSNSGFQPLNFKPTQADQAYLAWLAKKNQLNMAATNEISKYFDMGTLFQLSNSQSEKQLQAAGKGYHTQLEQYRK